MAANPRDDNNVPVLAGQSSTDATKTAVVAVNPSTNAVIVQII
jgi:hypothetical protein